MKRFVIMNDMSPIDGERAAAHAGELECRRVYTFRADETGDGNTLEGYAAVFNDWTEIHDAFGSFDERIAPGAFKRTLGMKDPVIQFDHGTHPLIGSIPLGRFTKLEEDARGLFVRARLTDNWLVAPVRDAIRDGAITGMSFKFRVVSDRWENDGERDKRTITEVDLYEAGPVVFPAYDTTTVGVRSVDGAYLAEAVDRLSTDARNELAMILRGTDETSPAATTPPVSATAPSPNTPPENGHVQASNPTRRRARIAAILNTE